LTDPSARHFAAQWCTAPPERLLDVSDIVCGRLYGLPPAQLRARVVEDVPRFSCELELEGKKNPPNASAAVDALLKATEWTPPFFIEAPAVEPVTSDTPPVNIGR